MVAGVSRTLAFLAALALAATACGKSAPPSPPSGEVGGGLGSTSTSGVEAPPAPTDDDGNPRSSVTTRRPRVPTGPSSGDRPEDDATGRALREAANGPPGSFAGVLLAPGPASKIVIDVLVQSGAAADDAIVASIRQIVAAASEKPVAVRGPTEFDASGNVHTPDDIRRFADQRGQPEQGNGTAVVHFLFLDGSFSEPGVLGVAVRGDTVAVFPDQASRAATPFASSSRIERAVATHEIGHLLGLVDIFLDEGRDDPEHPGHSTNRNSVMYWAVESDVVAQVLGGPPPVNFDAADQATLRSIRNGATRA